MKQNIYAYWFVFSHVMQNNVVLLSIYAFILNLQIISYQGHAIYG